MESKNLPAVRRPRLPDAEEFPRAAQAKATREMVTVAPARAAGSPHLAPPAILAAPPDLRSLLIAFRRRWRLAVGLGLAVAIAAASAAWFLSDPWLFTARAFLHIDSQKPKILFDTMDSQTNFNTYQQRQVAMLRTRMVLNSALRDPKVSQLALVREQPDPIDWLSKQVQADFSQSPETLRISITGADSNGVLVIVDAVREAFLREVVEKDRQAREERYSQLQKLYDQYESTLETQKKRIESLAEQAKSGDERVLSTLQSLALLEGSAMRKELLDMRAEIRKAQRRIVPAGDREKVKQELKVPDDVIEEAIKKDIRMFNLENDIAKIGKAMDAIRERSPNPESEPAFIRLKKYLEEATAKRDALRAQLQPAIAEELKKQLLRKLETDWAHDDVELVKLNKFAADLQSLVDHDQGKIADTGRSAVTIGRIKEEIDRIDPFAKKAAFEVEAMKTESTATPRIRRLDDPFVEKRVGLAAMAATGSGLGGFALVVLAVAFLEFRTRRVNGVEDVSRGLKLPVVGTMPLVQPRNAYGKTRGRRSSQALWEQLLIESVDAARTMLLHSARQKQYRVVMVTSAVAGEGKTLLSSHLAASLARGGRRALLIDGDMRRPSLNKVFGLENQVGLSEALRGEIDIREAVQSGPIDGLWLVAAGHYDAASLRALAQGHLQKLLDQIRREYDLIIIDSSPILPVVDSQIIAQTADGVILSVLRNVSRLPLIFEAYERLTVFQVDLLGAVVHGASAGGYGSHYSYSYLPVRSDKEDTEDGKEE